MWHCLRGKARTGTYLGFQARLPTLKCRTPPSLSEQDSCKRFESRLDFLLCEYIATSFPVRSECVMNLTQNVLC